MTDTIPASADNIRLFFEPPGSLRLTVSDDRSYPVVKLYQAWPLTDPGRHLSFHDAKGEEFLMLDGLSDLAGENREAAEEELKRRYLTARVEAVTGIRTEFGVTYWHVRTERGDRDFVVQSISESCLWLSDAHILITDVDGNRFEIVNRNALDAESRTRLETVL